MMKMKNQDASPSTPGFRRSSDSKPRSQRSHRHSAIPSLFRSKVSSKTDRPTSSPLQKAVKGMDPLRKQSYSLLSVANPMPPTPGDPSSSRRRFASMPQPLPSELQTQIDIDNDRIARGKASPPLVDFTRFEDTYRGPRLGDFEGLVTNTSRSRSGMRSSSSGVRPTSKSESPPDPHGSRYLTVSKSESEFSPEPAARRKPDPKLVLASLTDILGSPEEVGELLDAHDLLGAHQLDQLHFEERETAKTALLEKGRVDIQGRRGPLAVLGESLRNAWVYSSTTYVLAGREHELPTLVVHCVEELYRTGIYQANLFRSLPNRSRLLELINIFDSEEQLPGSVIRSRQRPIGAKVYPKAGFGFNTSLHLESTPDICALLTTYLSSLPEPLLIRPLFRAIWSWCDIEHDEEDRAKQKESFGPGLSPIPMARSYTNPTEAVHILIAQLVLHLLPSPNFSLLVYLLAFFSQVALVKEENGVGIQDLSRMFGSRLFGSSAGPSSSMKDKGKAKGPDDDVSNLPTESEKMMCWFLRRWAPIYDGLFEVVEEAKMGMFKRPLMRKDSFGKDVLSAWVDQPDGDDSFRDLRDGDGDEHSENDEDADDDQGVQEISSVVASSFGFQSESSDTQPTDTSVLGGNASTPQIRIQVSPPQDHSTPKPFNSKGRKSSSLSIRSTDPIKLDEYVMITAASSPAISRTPSMTKKSTSAADETLDVVQLHARSLSSSTYPGSPQPPVDERLMDISIAGLLSDQTIPTVVLETSEKSHVLHEREGSFSTRTYCTRSTQTEPHAPGRCSKHDKHFPTDDQHNLEQCQMRQTLQIIAELEKQLQDRTECLTDSLKDLARCKLELEACRRREQMKELKGFFQC